MLATVQAAYEPTGTVHVEWSAQRSGARRRLRPLAAFRLPPQCAGAGVGFCEDGAPSEPTGFARTALPAANPDLSPSSSPDREHSALRRGASPGAAPSASDAAGFAAASAAVNEALTLLRDVEEALERQLQDLRSYRTRGHAGVAGPAPTGE